MPAWQRDFQAACHGIGYIAKLNHFDMATASFMSAHVNVMLFKLTLLGGHVDE